MLMKKEWEHKHMIHISKYMMCVGGIIYRKIYYIMSGYGKIWENDDDFYLENVKIFDMDANTYNLIHIIFFKTIRKSEMRSKKIKFNSIFLVYWRNSWMHCY